MKVADLIKDKKKNQAYVPPDRYVNDTYRIPTSIFPFDLSIGGGIPIFNLTCLFGPPSSGKTLVASKVMAASQKICWNCFEYLDYCTCGQHLKKYPVIIDNEGFDSDWCSNQGVDLDNLYVFRSNIGEECVDTLFDVLHADDVGLVVLDSISNVIPDAEITDSAMKNHMGQAPRLQASLVRKVQRAFVDKMREGQNITFLAMGQITANIGDHYGAAEKIKCGWAARHAFRLACRMSQLKTNSEFVDKETDLPFFGKFKSNVAAQGNKRQVFTLQATSEFFVCLKNHGDNYVGEVLDYKTLFKYMDQVGLLDRSRWSSVFDDMTFSTKTDMMQYWKENEDYLAHIKKKVVDYYVKAEKGLIEMPEKQQIEEETE